MRRLYGPLFFDVVTVDAWYATGPFIKAVQHLGWEVVSVLNQERYEIYQEATALTKNQPPQRYEWEDRKVELWEAKDLPFTDEAIGSMRVVLAEERWPEHQRVGGTKVIQEKHRSWRWRASQELDPYSMQIIWQTGHPPTVGYRETCVQRTDTTLMGLGTFAL